MVPKMVPIWPFAVFKLNKINILVEFCGTQGRTRTGTPVKAGDFESPASTIPPLGPNQPFTRGAKKAPEHQSKPLGFGCNSPSSDGVCSIKPIRTYGR